MLIKVRLGEGRFVLHFLPICEKFLVSKDGESMQPKWFRIQNPLRFCPFQARYFKEQDIDGRCNPLHQLRDSHTSQIGLLFHSIIRRCGKRRDHTTY